MKIVEPKDEKAARKAFENRNVDVISGLEKRKIVINHVLANLAHKNKITVGFNFDDVMNAKDRAKVLWRMMFNVKLCRKKKVSMLFLGSKKDQAFGRVIGMTPGEARKAMKFVKKKRDIEVE